MRSLKLVRRRFRNGFREGMWFVKKSAVTGYLLPFMDDICVARTVLERDIYTVFLCMHPTGQAAKSLKATTKQQ